MVSVKLEQKHIDLGKDRRMQLMSCPIAHAIRDLVKPNHIVTVGTGSVGIGNAVSQMVYIYIPQPMKKIIMKFDETGEISPCEFELDIPQHFLKEAV